MAPVSSLGQRASIRLGERRGLARGRAKVLAVGELPHLAGRDAELAAESANEGGIAGKATFEAMSMIRQGRNADEISIA